MPGKMPARAAKLKLMGGKLVSAKSKTGDPQCSAAASAWQNSLRGNPVGMAIETAMKILGQCRAKARALKQAAGHRNAGNEAKAQHLEHRAQSGGPVTAKDRLAKARELRAARNADIMNPNSDRNNRQFDAAVARRKAESDVKRADTRAVVNARAKEMGKSYSDARKSFYLKPQEHARAQRAARSADVRTDLGATKPAMSLREQAAQHRAGKGTAAERAKAISEKLKTKAAAANNELRKVDNAKNRHQGSWESYQKLITRDEKAMAVANRVMKANRRLTEIRKQVDPSAFGMTRGSQQRKDLASQIRGTRAKVREVDTKIARASYDPNAEQVHAFGLWGEIGQNRGKSARAKAKTLARYDRQAKTVVPLAQGKQANLAHLAELRRRAKQLRPGVSAPR